METLPNTRIVYLASASNIHTKRWVRHFTQKGFQISILSLHNSDLDTTHSVYCLNNQPGLFGWLFRIYEARQLIKKIDPLFVHAHYAGSYGLIGALAGFRPLLLSVWGSDVFEFPRLSKLRNLIVRYNFFKANIICSTSHIMALEIGKYSKKIVVVTPFGIDCEEYKPMKSKNRNKSKIIIGTVKKLEHHYGIELLIQAFALLIKKQPNISLELRIVGDGPLRGDLEHQSHDLGVNSMVSFLGRISQDQVPKYLNDFDVFAALSINESFGVAVLEASACGLPVVVSDAGGLPEVVDDHKTGFVLPVGDVYQAADALEALVLNPELRERMGKAGRSFVLTHYEWRHTARIMEEVYSATLTRNCESECSGSGL
jgi:L-malate glycosyltransferase